jgi:hypothetical protein
MPTDKVCVLKTRRGQAIATASRNSKQQQQQQAATASSNSKHHQQHQAATASSKDAMFLHIYIYT